MILKLILKNDLKKWSWNWSKKIILKIPLLVICDQFCLSSKFGKFLTSHHFVWQDWTINTGLTCSCPRDWRLFLSLGIMMGCQIEGPLKLPVHHRESTLSVQWGPSTSPPLCRKWVFTQSDSNILWYIRVFQYAIYIYIHILIYI